MNPKSLAEGAKAAAKGATSGALKGGVNWGGRAAQGKVMTELGTRLQERVNRPKPGPEGGA